MTDWDDDRKTAFVTQQFEAQCFHYARYYPDMASDIVLIGDRKAGRLLVQRWPKEIRIVDITLSPEFRSQGIGTRLLRALQEEAAKAGKLLSIHVERFNRALGLYQRLGFRLSEDKGVYLLLAWRADDSQPLVR